MHRSAENIAIIFTAREELRCAGAGSPATAALLSRLSYQKTIFAYAVGVGSRASALLSAVNPPQRPTAAPRRLPRRPARSAQPRRVHGLCWRCSAHPMPLADGVSSKVCAEHPYPVKLYVQAAHKVASFGTNLWNWYHILGARRYWYRRFSQ